VWGGTDLQLMVLSVLLGHSTWHLYRKVIARNACVSQVDPRRTNPAVHVLDGTNPMQ
jgi:hypothetical protein